MTFYCVSLPLYHFQVPIVAGGKKKRVDEKKVAIDGEIITADGKKVAIDAESITTDGKKVAIDGEKLASVGKKIAIDGEKLAISDQVDGEKLGKQIASKKVVGKNKKVAEEKRKKVGNEKKNNNAKQNAIVKNQKLKGNQVSGKTFHKPLISPPSLIKPPIFVNMFVTELVVQILVKGGYLCIKLV